MNVTDSGAAHPGSGVMSPAVVAAGRLRPTAPVAVAGSSITPRDIWLMVRRRWLLVLVTAMLLAIAGLGLNVAWWYWWPSWPGQAWLKVESPTVPEALGPTLMTPAELIAQFQRTEATIIRSRQYAQAVLADPKIRETDWYKRNEKNALSKFEETLSVTPIRDQSVISVGFTTRNQEDGPRIVNALVDVYLQDRMKRVTSDLDEKLAGLRRQQTTLQVQLNQQSRSIEEYVKSEKIPVLLGRQVETDTELGKLAEARSEIQFTNEATKAALESMKQQDPASWVPGSMQQARIDDDPQVRGLKQLALSLEEEREVRNQQLGSDHMFIERLDERIRIAKRDLQAKQAELRQRIFIETLGDYENAVSSNETSLKQIDEQIATIRDKLNEMDPKIVHYQAMEDEKKVLADFKAEVDNMVKTTQATRDATRTRGGQVMLWSSAMASPKKSSPNLWVNIPASLVLSVLLAVGLAFLLEYLDKSVRSSQDIRRHTNLAYLGSIPALQEDEANPQDMYSVVTHAPHSILAEAFRQVRTNIMFSCTTGKCRSMLVTSPGPDDGRTCVSVNLAASIALSGQKVLLIDANFRKPALNRLFANLPEVGFAELLSGTATLEQAVRKTDTEGLWVVGSGKAPQYHASMLGSSTLGPIINKLTEQFDQVILDGPPALLSADAVALASQVAGILFVARASKNSRGELNRMREEISVLNGHIHGVVLNGVQATSGGYFKKRYRLFYDYQQSLETESASVQTSQHVRENYPPGPRQT